MIRAVYDTNIVVSGTLTPGLTPPSQIIDAVVDGRVTLVSSHILIDEYLDVLSRTKFVRRLAAIGKTADELVSDYLHLVEIIEVIAIPTAVAGDPDDDHVLACALSGHAEYIVSGDKHLLQLKQYEDIQICTAREFLNVLDLSLPSTENDSI
jgi:putative PIN family toxin of toxin-antitoxin system